METYTSQIVTIVIKTETDPATVRDLVNRAMQEVVGEIKAWGDEASFDAKETSVSACKMVKEQ